MATTNPNAPTQAGQAPVAGGHSGAESAPKSSIYGEVTGLPTNVQVAWDDAVARRNKLPALSDKVSAAYNRAESFFKDVPDYAGYDDKGNPIGAPIGSHREVPKSQVPAYTAALQQATSLERDYHAEEQSIGETFGNLNATITTLTTSTASNNLDREKLRQAQAQAAQMSTYYQAQAANYQAQADQTQAEAAYNAALREAYPADQAAAHQKRVDEAKIALDESNGRLNNANAAAQEAANGVAPELAQAGLAIQQAKAAVAPRLEEAGAKTAEAGASSAGSKAAVDAATAAHAGEVAGATASSATSQAAIDAANAAVAGQAANAAIQEAVSRGDLNAAQAAEVMALLEGKKQYAQAQIEGQQAANAQTRLQTHQLQVGDVQTKIEQLGEAVKNGMHPAQADRLMEDYLSGSTPFQRRQQRETQLSGAMNQALSYGMGVLPGQQYLPGAEPGGAYDQAFSKLGVDLPNVQLSDARPLTSFVQAQGIQTTEQPAPSMFSATGGYTPPPAPSMTPQGAATAAPAVTPPPAAGQPTSVSQPTHAAVPVVTTAQLLGQQPAQTAAEGGTYYNPDDYYPVDILGPFPQSTGNMTGMGGSRYPNISGTTVDMLPSSTPYVVDPRLITPNAAGGTTVVPRAMQGMLHQPKVARIPIFAAHRAGHRPMFKGG